MVDRVMWITSGLYEVPFQQIPEVLLCIWVCRNHSKFWFSVFKNRTDVKFLKPKTRFPRNQTAGFWMVFTLFSQFKSQSSLLYGITLHIKHPKNVCGCRLHNGRCCMLNQSSVLKFTVKLIKLCVKVLKNSADLH